MPDELDPTLLFDMLDASVPRNSQPHILVVGSLAAAYHHRDQLKNRAVNTKDADVIIHPAGAIKESKRIAQQLLDDGWRRTEKGSPSAASVPAAELRAIRLYPPKSEAFFIELLAFPERTQKTLKTWVRLELDDGWYGLPSFRFLGLAEVHVQTATNGLRYAAPSMMALGNLLSHPKMGLETMTQPIGGRTLRRAAKDLGRVLALARLATREDTEKWPDEWEGALRRIFGEDECRALAKDVGSGLRELFENPDAVDEARHAVDVGLLSGFGITGDQLKALGQQLLADAIDPVAARFR